MNMNRRSGGMALMTPPSLLINAVQHWGFNYPLPHDIDTMCCPSLPTKSAYSTHAGANFLSVSSDQCVFCFFSTTAVADVQMVENKELRNKI